MFEKHSKPLISCTTSKNDFSDRIAMAANELGTDFWSSTDLKLSFQKCNDRKSSCMIVDYETTESLDNLILSRQVRTRSLLVAIPVGDVRAAFDSASAGAINIMEKPLAFQELVLNLETALVSDSKLENLIASEGRFATEFFDSLTRREKLILGLLMDGEPNKRVAAKLDIGLRTVEAERASVMKKLNATSFVDLIRCVTNVETDLVQTKKEIFGRMLSKYSRASQ